jgi:hypothetical protein
MAMQVDIPNHAAPIWTRRGDFGITNRGLSWRPGYRSV